MEQTLGKDAPAREGLYIGQDYSVVARVIVPGALQIAAMTSLTSRHCRAFLPVAEVVELARQEFGFVHIDPSRGLGFVTGRVLAMEPRPTLELAEQLLAPLSESVEMIVGDDRHSDTDFVKCYVIPNEPIEIQWVYDGHETRVAHLLDRLREVLDYELVE